MVNIEICDYCNLQCPYCWIPKTDSIQTMPLDEFCWTLEYLSEEDHDIIITGGEPTLHPRFENILYEANKYGGSVDANVKIETNGINLDQYLPYIGNNIDIVINCFDLLNTQYENQFNKMFRTMQSLGWLHDKVILKCTLYPEQQDYSYFWEIVKKYEIEKAQVTIAAYGKYLNDKEYFYKTMKPIFLRFCQQAIYYNCLLEVDCHHIPYCYFGPQERELLAESLDKDYSEEEFCTNSLTILPNGNITWCHGFINPIDLEQFETIEEVKRYLTIKKLPAGLAQNCIGRCSECNRNEILQCQGGCFLFANQEEIDGEKDS